MKTQLPAIVVFLFAPSSVTGELLSSPPHSVCDHKKPASLAGSFYLRLSLTRLTALFLPAASLCRSPRSLQLITQTPSSL